jgi:hypothetical protein
MAEKPTPEPEAIERWTARRKAALLAQAGFKIIIPPSTLKRDRHNLAVAVQSQDGRLHSSKLAGRRHPLKRHKACRAVSKTDAR